MIANSNRVCQLFDTRWPIVQGGMVWCSGWRLAAAVSNEGGLGLIGSGSMNADLLRQHIKCLQSATQSPFGVNVPLLYAHTKEIMEVILEEDVKIVFTSAGNPSTWTAYLKDRGVKVVHVVSSLKFALKAQAAGVDAIVAEGFEAGGHNGREETTTMVLIPIISQNVEIPVIAAGGIASGRAMLAAEVLGAEGFQIGSLFAASIESSASEAFKSRVVEMQEGETMLGLKKLNPVRMIKNKFYDQVREAEDRGASKEELAAILGKGRSKRGIFEGDLVEGELEIGQVGYAINNVRSVKEIMNSLKTEYTEAKRKFC